MVAEDDCYVINLLMKFPWKAGERKSIAGDSALAPADSVICLALRSPKPRRTHSW